MKRIVFMRFKTVMEQSACCIHTPWRWPLSWAIDNLLMFFECLCDRFIIWSSSTLNYTKFPWENILRNRACQHKFLNIHGIVEQLWLLQYLWNMLVVLVECLQIRFCCGSCSFCSFSLIYPIRWSIDDQRWRWFNFLEFFSCNLGSLGNITRTELVALFVAVVGFFNVSDCAWLERSHWRRRKLHLCEGHRFRFEIFPWSRQGTHQSKFFETRSIFFNFSCLGFQGFQTNMVPAEHSKTSCFGNRLFICRIAFNPS